MTNASVTFLTSTQESNWLENSVFLSELYISDFLTLSLDHMNELELLRAIERTFESFLFFFRIFFRDLSEDDISFLTIRLDIAFFHFILPLLTESVLMFSQYTSNYSSLMIFIDLSLSPHPHFIFQSYQSSSPSPIHKLFSWQSRSIFRYSPLTERRQSNLYSKCIGSWCGFTSFSRSYWISR